MVPFINSDIIIIAERIANTYSNRAGRPIMVPRKGINNIAISVTRNVLTPHTTIVVNMYEGFDAFVTATDTKIQTSCKVNKNVAI